MARQHRLKRFVAWPSVCLPDIYYYANYKDKRSKASTFAA